MHIVKVNGNIGNVRLPLIWSQSVCSAYKIKVYVDKKVYLDL